MFVYSVGIIDHWSGWQRPEDVFKTGPADDFEALHDWKDWERLWSEARDLAGRLGWEGDVRQGQFVTVLPNAPDEFSEGAVVIGWKQDNNGATFIASERYHLPWLDDCDLVTSADKPKGEAT